MLGLIDKERLLSIMDRFISILRWGIRKVLGQSSMLSTPMRRGEHLHEITSVVVTVLMNCSGNLRKLLGPRTTYDLWHIDQTFTPNVPSTTFFWVLEIPESGGGDTAFTSLTAAYEALSPAFRETLHGLKLHHTFSSKRRFSLSALSPASRRYNKVMSDRPDNRRSIDTTVTTSTMGDMPVVQVESHLVDPAYRWTTANRVG